MITDVDLAVGKRLRCRRRILGLTQAQVAAHCGVRFQQVQKYETAANTLSVWRLLQLCKALHTTPADILRDLSA